MPRRDLSQAEVERFWRADRVRVIACKDKHQGLVEWAEDIIKALGRGRRS